LTLGNVGQPQGQAFTISYDFAGTLELDKNPGRVVNTLDNFTLGCGQVHLRNLTVGKHRLGKLAFVKVDDGRAQIVDRSAGQFLSALAANWHYFFRELRRSFRRQIFFIASVRKRTSLMSAGANSGRCELSRSSARIIRARSRSWIIR